MLQQISPRDRRFLVLWFIAALLMRGAAVWTLAGNLEKDNDGYRQLAENVRARGVFGFGEGEQLQPTAFRPPLYPLLLAPAVANGQLRLAWVAMLHVALGAVTVAATWLAARKTGFALGAHAAALLVLLDPILLIQSSQLMTETLAACFVAIIMLVLIEATGQQADAGEDASEQTDQSTAARTWPWLLLGALLGAACLCRPTFLASTAFLLLGLILVALQKQKSHSQKLRQQSSPKRTASISLAAWRTKLRPAALVALAALPLPALWTVRNYRDLGRPIIATTHGGYTLLLGNNPSFYSHLRDPQTNLPWQAESLDRRINQLKQENQWSELEYDRWAGAQARQHIAADPSGFVRSAVHRLLRLWGVLPAQLTAQETSTRRLFRFLVAAWYSVLFALIAWGAVGRPKLPGCTPYVWIWIVAFAASFSALHTLYWCDMRMRGPLAAPLAIAACFGLERLLVLLRRRKRGGEK